MADWREVEPGKLAGVIKRHRYLSTNKTLEIEFQDGRRWVHGSVPQSLYDEFAAASEPAAFWATRIRMVFEGNSTQKRHPVVKVA
jgi:hypothetical protein